MKSKKPVSMSEKSLHKAVCDYIRYQYPGILFNSDSSGIKLTMGQSVQMKALKSNKGYPDLMIFEARKGYHGLFIELKIEGTKLYKRDGSFVNDHIEEQAACIAKLIAAGYHASFGIGFTDTIETINSYLKK